MKRRNYRNSLEFIEAGLGACWANSESLVFSAKCLRDSKQHALALSVSVLALEELGKLLCIDGLLFARSDEGKAQAYSRSLKSHSHKLSAIELFPLLLGGLASADPRYKGELRFRQAIAIGVSDLKERGNRVLSLMKNASFQDLDQWKQSGFYAQPCEEGFVTPAQAVAPEISDAVYMLAWRAVTTLDFLLKDGNLQRYINVARAIRAKLSEEAHAELEQAAGELALELFPSMDENKVTNLQ